jgi:myo-inositol-1-phosphate synthase
MGGTNTIALHNTCEDSLLAAPVMLDLVILAELLERIKYRRDEMREFAPLSAIMSLLSYLLKAPLVPAGVLLIICPNLFFIYLISIS